MTSVDLANCLYDVFMETVTEEPSYTAKSTAIGEESSSTAIEAATGTEAAPCECSLFWYGIYHRR
jgi:hypothetical protein